MTFEITSDAWAFARGSDGRVTVLRNGIDYGELTAHGTRGRRDYHWKFRRWIDSPAEVAGVTLADAKRWIKTRREPDA